MERLDRPAIVDESRGEPVEQFRMRRPRPRDPEIPRALLQPAPEHFLPQSPNLFWPEDRTWCVATEIDLFCTLIGGSEEMADRLIADPLLEAWRVFPDDPITWDSDDINQ